VSDLDGGHVRNVARAAFGEAPSRFAYPIAAAVRAHFEQGVPIIESPLAEGVPPEPLFAAAERIVHLVDDVASDDAYTRRTCLELVDGVAESVGVVALARSDFEPGDVTEQGRRPPRPETLRGAGSHPSGIGMSSWLRTLQPRNLSGGNERALCGERRRGHWSQIWPFTPGIASSEILGLYHHEQWSTLGF
jgi:hypothetical protein